MGGSGAGVSNAYNHVLFTENMKVYSDSKVSALLRDVTVDQRIRFLNSRENYTHPLKKTAAEKEKCNTKRAEAVGVTASARKKGLCVACLLCHFLYGAGGGSTAEKYSRADCHAAAGILGGEEAGKGNFAGRVKAGD